MVNAVEVSEALTYWKLYMLTVSPVVWSVPAETAKLIAVVPPEALSISVFVPLPPSIALSEP